MHKIYINNRQLYNNNSGQVHRVDAIFFSHLQEKIICMQKFKHAQSLNPD